MTNSKQGITIEIGAECTFAFEWVEDREEYKEEVVGVRLGNWFCGLFPRIESEE